MDSINKEAINPLANTLGLFDVKSGIVHKGNVHAEGNNFSAKATGTIWYNDLRVTVLTPWFVARETFSIYNCRMFK